MIPSNAKTSILRQLDRAFPPNPLAFMQAQEQSEHEISKSEGSMGEYLKELQNKSVDVLDFGCGWGGETIWLSRQVRTATGVDVDLNSIDEAKRRVSEDSTLNNCAFIHYDGDSLPFLENTFDAVFSTDVFEHVSSISRTLFEIHRVLKPGGVLITKFGPLFYSPLGYHLYWACQVPYAHLLFGLEPILTLRNERAQENISASNWTEMGLNKITARDFKTAAQTANFYLNRFNIIPVRGLKSLAKIPVVGNLFIFGLDVKLTKLI